MLAPAALLTMLVDCDRLVSMHDAESQTNIDRDRRGRMANVRRKSTAAIRPLFYWYLFRRLEW